MYSIVSVQMFNLLINSYWGLLIFCTEYEYCKLTAEHEVGRNIALFQLCYTLTNNHSDNKAILEQITCYQ